MGLQRYYFFLTMQIFLDFFVANFYFYPQVVSFFSVLTVKQGLKVSIFVVPCIEAGSFLLTLPSVRNEPPVIE